MTHIERMKKECKELHEKIQKGQEFWLKESEKEEFTDERQRKMLSLQLDAMLTYEKILRYRIDYDVEKSK